MEGTQNMFASFRSTLSSRRAAGVQKRGCRAFRPELGRLEDRKLKDGAVSLVAGTVQIQANGPSDSALVFYVDKGHAIVGVMLDKQLTLYARSQVSSIQFTGSSGTNVFGNLTEINDTATGGNGMNTFVGGSGNNTFWGGSGQNVFVVSASSGTDSLTGGNGTNIFVGGTGHNTLSGGTGNNYIWADTGVNVIVDNGGHNWAVMDSTTTIVKR
jgi:Ca2+-binding RTX toxin-like protein